MGEVVHLPDMAGVAVRPSDVRKYINDRRTEIAGGEPLQIRLPARVKALILEAISSERTLSLAEWIVTAAEMEAQAVLDDRRGGS